MKIEKRVLAEKLNKLKPITATRGDIDCLKGILLKNNTLSAFNGEVGASSILDIETEEEFIISPNAIELISKLPDGEIDITVDSKNTLNIKSNGIKSKSKSFDVRDFPLTQEINDGETMMIKAEELNTALAQVLYSVDENQVRQMVLTGVYFEGDGSKLNIVGCDGYRLSWNKIDYDKVVDFIIPKTSLIKLLKFGLKGEIKILHNKKVAEFIAGENIFTTRLLGEKYLDYKRIIPDFDNKMMLDKKQLLDMIERCAVSTGDDKVILIIEGDKLTVTTTTQTGDYKEIMDIDNRGDNNITIAFNIKYLAEALKSQKTDRVLIKYGGEVQPFVIEEAGKNISLVLPVRINS